MEKTFGFHPLGVWCDNTSEFVTGMLRTGKAGSNTASDHIEILSDAIKQIPASHRKHLLIRSDRAGGSRTLLEWLTTQNQVKGRRVEYSVGLAITAKVREAIRKIPKHVWTPALDANGEARHRAHARVKDRIRHPKDTGLGRFPSRD